MCTQMVALFNENKMATVDEEHAYKKREEIGLRRQFFFFFALPASLSFCHNVKEQSKRRQIEETLAITT